MVLPVVPLPSSAGVMTSHFDHTWLLKIVHYIVGSLYSVKHCYCKSDFCIVCFEAVDIFKNHVVHTCTCTAYYLYVNRQTRPLDNVRKGAVLAWLVTVQVLHVF